MFTGIIESTGQIVSLSGDADQKRFIVEAPFANELTAGQSVAHNGVCLTVESSEANRYSVTLIRQTLETSSLGSLREGARVNLERCLPSGGRLDGHIVQGHVDGTGRIVDMIPESGQTRFRIRYAAEFEPLIVPRGSICVDGISLTIAGSDPAAHTFDVCLIPHTLKVTTAGAWSGGDVVNLEFDVIGKYVKKWMDLRA